MIFAPRPAGLDVQRHGTRWYVYYHRACCPWSVGATSEPGEASPLPTIAKALEQASAPCLCSICQRSSRILDGGSA